MADPSEISELVDQALEILSAFGIPIDNLTARRKMKMAKVFIAVAGLKPGMAWTDLVFDDPHHRPRTRTIIQWVNENLGESISPGSYDDIRRKDLVFLVEAGIVLNSAGNDAAAMNDGTRGFAINPAYATQIQKFGTPQWSTTLAEFMSGRKMLVDELKQARLRAMLPVTIEGEEVVFSPGEHNQIQKAVIESFLPRFGSGAEVVYVGDTVDKYLFLNKEKLSGLGFFEIGHGKLPDVLAYSAERNWLFLVEAVHSANPINPMRKRTLEQLTNECSAEIVFVTAFLNRSSFKKFAAEIAWETEVWIVDDPDHMIHFNGDKFLGPHDSSQDISTP